MTWQGGYNIVKNTPKTFDRGFIEPTDDPELQEKQNNEIQRRINVAIKKSSALRKLAEENGLIQEEAQEIE